MTAQRGNDGGLAAHDPAIDSSRGAEQRSDDATLPTRVRWTRWVYLGLTWIFVGCIFGQVFCAGMAIFVDSLYWRWHTNFIHTFEYLPLLMLGFAFAARLPVAMRWLTFALFILIYVQYATANIGGMAGAFHPVSALVIVWIAVSLTGRAWQLARTAHTQVRLAA